MAETLLGETLDIHGGGHDLIFPHHENERAQSECAHAGAPLARFWVHNGFVTMDHEKMAKSTGNVLLVRELLREAPGEVIRLALLSAHYRQPLDWSAETLPDARRKLDRLYGALRQVQDVEARAATGGALDAFYAALDDDLNTPAALAELFEIARALNREGAEAASSLKEALQQGGGALGLLGSDPEQWFAPQADAGVDAAEIDRLVAMRAAAKKRKDYGEADRIRVGLSERGIHLEDSPQGTRWRVAGTS
jgi:cysteinyl-tRNA synthetase